MSEPAARVYEGVLDMLSDVDNPTPMVRLNRVVPHSHSRFYAKLEWYNPFGLSQRPGCAQPDSGRLGEGAAE